MWDELQALKAQVEKLEALNDENAAKIQRCQERDLERLSKRVETLEALNKANLEALQERKEKTDVLARQVERLTDHVERLTDRVEGERGVYYIKEYNLAGDGQNVVQLYDDVVCAEISYMYDYGHFSYDMPSNDFYRKKGSDGAVLREKTDKRITNNTRVAYEGKKDKVDVTKVLNEYCKDYPCCPDYTALFDHDFLKRNGMDDHAPKVLRVLYKSHMGLTTQPSRMKHLGHSYLCPSYQQLYPRVKRHLQQTRSPASVETRLDSFFKEHIVLVGGNYYEKNKETKVNPQFGGRLVPKYHRLLDPADGWSELPKHFD